MILSKILEAARGPPRFIDGKMVFPVPRWKVLLCMEAASVFAARLRSSSFLLVASYRLLMVLSLLCIFWYLLVLPVLEMVFMPFKEGLKSD